MLQPKDLETKRLLREKKRKARKEIKIWLDKYKSERGCSNCNEVRIATLDFHHIDPSTKTIEVSEAIRMRWSRSSIEKEIAKCSLICANCHRCEHNRNYGVNDYIYDNIVYFARGTRS